MLLTACVSSFAEGTVVAVFVVTVAIVVDVVTASRVTSSTLVLIVPSGCAVVLGVVAAIVEVLC